MSYIVSFEVYGHRALGAQDVRDAFGPGAVVEERLDGSYTVVFGGQGFVLENWMSVLSSAGLVQWLAQVRGVPAYTHMYSAVFDEKMIDGRYGPDIDGALRTAFAALASRADGVSVFLHELAIDYTDEETGQEFTLRAEDDRSPRPSEHDALVLEWYGRMPAGPNPVANWILACERHHPDLVPTEYGQPLRPITGAAREYLLSAENNERYMTLREGTLLGDIDFRLPTLVERSGPGYLLSVNPQGAYSASCALLWQRARERMGLAALRRFFTNMGRGLGAEFATGQFLTGYASVSGLAEWTPGAAQRHSPQLGRDDELLGLPSAPSWWVWLGPDYARVVSGWLERGAPSSWVVEETGDGGVLVQTSTEPVVCEAGAGQWFPEEFLPTVGPVPRRRLVDWLLGTRPRAQVGPARVMPTWTRPTTDDADPGPGADGTNGPDTRPAGGPEPTTDAGVGADAGRAHNPPTDPGADGTSGHVASADTDRAHNPTTGPDTRPGADAPGPPRT